MVTQAVFRALDDPIRRSIVALLSRSRLSVTEIASHFEVSRPALSRHLRVLREAEVVSESRSGRERLYRLEPEVLDQAAEWLTDVAAGRDLEDRWDSRPYEVPDDAPDGASASGSQGVTTDWRQW